jgi:hypothetical protein
VKAPHKRVHSVVVVCTVEKKTSMHAVEDEINDNIYVQRKFQH